MSWAILLLFTFDLCNLVSSTDVHRNKGESYSFTCPAPHKEAVALSLYTRKEKKREVLYYFFETGDLTVHEDYTGRVNVSIDGKILTSNIWNLQLNDAGAYWCSCRLHFDQCEMTAEKGVFLFVNEQSNKPASSTAKHPNGMSDFLITVTALTAGSVMLLLVFLFGVWLVPKLKRRFRKNKEEITSSNGVYEVMNVPR